MSIATLLSQYHKVYAVDIIPEKVELINNRKSPIQDAYIEKYLSEKELDLAATLDAKLACSNPDFVVIAAPTKAFQLSRRIFARLNAKCLISGAFGVFRKSKAFSNQRDRWQRDMAPFFSVVFAGYVLTQIGMTVFAA